MEDLQSRFNKYLAGNPALQKQILGSPEMIAFAEEQAKALKGIVDAETASAPFSAAPSTSVSGVSVKGDGLEIEVNYNHAEAMRPSFSDNPSRPANLLFLLNCGWSYDKPAPWGYYNGKYTQAWNSRGGYRFVQAAVAKFNSQCPSFVKAEYDPAYDG